MWSPPRCSRLLRPACRSGTRWSSAGARELGPAAPCGTHCPAREQRVADLLDRRVDRLHERDASEHRLPWCSRRWPMKLAANTPVRSRISKRSTTPRPGMLKPSRPRAAGSRAAAAASVERVRRKFSTQIVMPAAPRRAGRRSGSASSVRPARGFITVFSARPATRGRPPGKDDAGLRIGLRVGLCLGLRLRLRLGLRVRRLGVAAKP